mgnify:CR=1 FL=1
MTTTTEARTKTLLALATEYLVAKETHARLTKQRDEAAMAADEAETKLVSAFKAIVDPEHRRSFYAWEIAPLVQKLVGELSK